jgi:hypothetical protein
MITNATGGENMTNKEKAEQEAEPTIELANHHIVLSITELLELVEEYLDAFSDEQLQALVKDVKNEQKLRRRGD